MTEYIAHNDRSTDESRIAYYHRLLGGEYPPSTYQADIYHWIKTGRGIGIVNAVAGSGKTHTLVYGAKLLSGNALFVAFSKAIQETLSLKLQNTSMVAKTVHSIGYGIIAKHIQAQATNKVYLKTDDKKYRQLCDQHVTQNQALDAITKELLADDIVPDWSGILYDLVHFARCTLTDPESTSAVRAMAFKYNVDYYGEYGGDIIFREIAPVIREGSYIALNSGIIDFTDMIYLPYYWRLPAPTYLWVFVDECQDLSACQLDLVLKLQAHGGRMLFVGDPYQAIFGFAGADSNSFWNIKDATKATELPLSVNYRCPSSHIKAVREKGTVPHIEARPGAPEGVIRRINEDKLETEIREGDMILCRLTAPLIATAIELIAKRIPARVKGRDIGKELAKLAKKIMAKCNTFEDFPDMVDAYLAKETKRLMRNGGHEGKVQSVADKCMCLQIIYSSTEVKTLDDMVVEIEELFSDNRASVTLCTVHRAKGLENLRIFIISPNKLPLKWKGQTGWQYDQELNLEYVAMTRAMDELIYVDEGSTLPGNLVTPSLMAVLQQLNEEAPIQGCEPPPANPYEPSIYTGAPLAGL